MSLLTTVVISGDRETIRKLNKLGRDLFMMKSAMASIGKELTSYYSGQAFASQGGVFGALFKWAALDTVYAQRKAKNYPGRGLLVKTGAMQQSFAYSADNSSVEITNTADYFKYHQSDEPRTKMPLRQMLGVNQVVISIVQQIVNDDVQRKIKEAGL